MNVMKHVLPAFCLSILIAAPAIAQQPPAQQQPNDNPGIAPAELQRMFDAYALLQAQEILRINDETYAKFLTRFKNLQDVRRRNLMERTRRIMDLQRLSKDPQSEESVIRERLTALREFETRAADEISKAYDAVDQILDTRQQAQFRAFEELMERRKLDLISRARQAARPAVRPNGPPRQPK